MDILRALAIVCVLCAHSSQYLIPFRFVNPVTDLFGFAGVELFFVLSGFLIGTILIKTYNKEFVSLFEEMRTFWIRRWFRTLPNYYLVLVLYFIVCYILVPAFDVSDKKYFLFLVFLENTFTPQPHFFNHAWSLSIEEWFYLSFPLVLIALHFFLKTSKQKKILYAIFTFIIGCLILRIVLALRLKLYWDAGIRKIMPLRLDAIAFGVLAAYIRFYYKDLWEKIGISALFIGIAGSFLLLGYYSYHYILGRSEGFFLKTFFFSLFSLFAAFTLPYIESIKGSRSSPVKKVITHISIISYSIYLIHPLLVIVLDTKYFSPVNNYIKFFLFLSSTIAISTLQYFYFEKPMTEMRDHLSSKNAKAFT